MGSYLSIVNDTQSTWMCKIGPDEAAIQVASVIATAVAFAAPIVGGMLGTLAASIDAAGAISVFGMSARALEVVSTVVDYADVLGEVSHFTMSVVEGVTDDLTKKGYTKIGPGQSHRWGKMTLSLWQQGTCVKTVIVDKKTVRLETLYMRPIFSGPTANSNNDYKIQTWLNKKGTEKKEVSMKDTPPRTLREEAQNVSIANSITVAKNVSVVEDKLYYFETHGKLVIDKLYYIDVKGVKRYIN